jgi:arylsulfate sulfotransferase
MTSRLIQILAKILPVLPILTFGACTDSDPIEPMPVQVPIGDLVTGVVDVTVDPSGRAPLAGVITFQSAVPARASLTVLGPEPIEHTVEEVLSEHAIPLLGLYPGTVNEVELRIETTDNRYAVDTLEVSTAPVPDFFPDIEILVAERERMEPGWNLASLSIGAGADFVTWPLMFDANGDIRWYLDLSHLGMTFLVERFENGHLRFGNGSSVYEMDMLGNEVRRWDFPGWTFHHEVIEKPDGNLLVAVSKVGESTSDDRVIEIARTSGAVVREWDLREVLDPNRREFSPNAIDWFHMNGIWYSEDDDALIISGRNQSAVVKVTGDNQLVWILAAHPGWGAAGLEGDGHETADFLLTAVDAEGNPYPQGVQLGDDALPEFRWSWGQHAPMLLPNGNLFLFDNGIDRMFATATTAFSRGVEYEIDETAGTVRQVWQYGEERGQDFYSPIISDVDLLPQTGNRLITPGVSFGAEPRAYVTEVTYPAGEVVFEAKILFRNALGSGSPEWGQFDIVYRSERLPPYPE